MSDELLPREPWDHPDVPDGIDGEAIYRRAVDIGGQRRRVRRKRRGVIGVVAAVAFIVPAAALLADASGSSSQGVVVANAPKVNTDGRDAGERERPQSSEDTPRASSQVPTTNASAKDAEPDSERSGLVPHTTPRSGSPSITAAGQPVETTSTIVGPPTPPRTTPKPPATVRTTTTTVPRRVGDINNDGHVGCKDLAILEASYEQSGPSLPADLNGDGVVGIVDLSILAAHWGVGGDDGTPCDPPT